MISIRETISVETTAAGVANSFIGYAGQFSGKFLGFSYTSDAGTSDYISTTAVMKITAEDSGIVFITSATPVGTGAQYFPRTPIHTDTGGNAGELASTQSPLYDHFPLASERIKFEIFNTSATPSLGTFTFVIEGTRQ